MKRHDPPPRSIVIHTCFIVPAFGPSSTEHFAHYPNLLAEIGAHRPIGVITEKGQVPINERWLYSDSIGAESYGAVRRTVASIYTLSRAYRRGARLFVLRYSRRVLCILSAMRLILPIRIAYWTSGQQEIQPDPSSMARVRKRFSDWATKRLYSLPDLVLTGPDSMRTYMSRVWDIPRDKIRIVRNDIDSRRFSPSVDLSNSETSARVLFVHRLSIRRGTRLLPKICADLSNRGYEGTLTVVGDGPDRQFLEQAQAAHEGVFKLDVVGEVPNSELPKLYRAADIFLMPSYEEGFPRVVLEAMASGTPVVAAKAGGTEELLPPGYPHMAEIGDWQAMASEIAVILDLDDAFILGNGLREWTVASFDTLVVIDDYLRVIDECVPGAHGP